MHKFILTVSLAALALGGTAYAHGMKGMGDKDITRAEAQAKCAEMFARMDVNKDGLLNDADQTARMGQMFDSLDTDKNGSISREEFNAAHAGMGMGHDGGMGHMDMPMGKPDGMKMGEGAMEGGHGQMGGMGAMGGMSHGDHPRGDMMMKMADKNGDGSVSAAEFTEAHLAMFDKADTNKDGTLTAAERKAAMAKMMSGMDMPKPVAPPTK